MKNILIVSQAATLEYIQLIQSAFPEETTFTVITGSKLNGDEYIEAPAYDPTSLKSRLRSWISFYFFILKWIKKNSGEKYDLVYCTSNPPINAYLGIKFKNTFNAKFVYMYWDLFPQSIEALIKPEFAKLICKFWNRWNSKNFCKIDQIITIGEVIKESIQSRIPYDLDIKVIPISVDTNFIQPIDKQKNSFLKNYSLLDYYIVLYSGKLGRGHNIEAILECASSMQEFEEIKFVFIGSGEKKPLVERYIEVNKNLCNNVVLLPLQPANEFNVSIACGDVAIASQEIASARNSLPSKVYSYMAAGEPIIGMCSDYDDLNDLITKYKIGIAVTDGSSETLKESILSMYYDKNQSMIYGKNGRKIAVREYSKESVQKKYADLFNEILAR